MMETCTRHDSRHAHPDGCWKCELEEHQQHKARCLELAQAGVITQDEAAYALGVGPPPSYEEPNMVKIIDEWRIPPGNPSACTAAAETPDPREPLHRPSGKRLAMIEGLEKLATRVYKATGKMPTCAIVPNPDGLTLFSTPAGDVKVHGDINCPMGGYIPPNPCPICDMGSAETHVFTPKLRPGKERLVPVMSPSGKLHNAITEAYHAMSKDSFVSQLQGAIEFATVLNEMEPRADYIRKQLKEREPRVSVEPDCAPDWWQG